MSTTSVFAKVTGSISGTARDSQGAVIPGVKVQIRSVETNVIQASTTDSAGFYNFPAVAVGHYEISFEKTGFGPFRQTNLLINVDTSLQIDATLQVGTMQQEVTVSSSAAQVETRTTQMGEVISDKEMTNLPLNGRSYTDLLALQPGVVPMSVAMYGSISPANSLNNGALSMSGARDAHSGFMVNGANTVEGFGSGTTLVPNLDSIAEFRIITSNAGAEYGNYSGGQVNVVTKSGTNTYHGSVFEFLRNSSLDSRNYFSPERGVFHQNQFGGTFGGPILHNKMFFFVDYQGTRQTIGVDTGLISVPSAAERLGDFSANPGALDNSVNGAAWANVLADRLGYSVTAGEPYYTPGCVSSSACVFPNAIIPQSAWSSVSANVLPLIPDANSGQFFTTSANAKTLQDDKGGIRIDANTRIGQISGYYHVDPWNSVSPYNSWGGSTVPGYPNVALGKAQLYVVSLTTTIGPSIVNQFTASYTRNKNIQGTSPGTGPSLAELGFADPSVGGIYQLSTQYQNWPVLGFNNFTLGPFNSIVSQFNNTYQGQDDLSKIIGTHTLKFGGNFHWDHIDLSHPNNASNGGFGFDGSETGVDFADMLIGAPAYFYQGTPAGLNLRSYYLGLYGEDSWRATHNLTINYGVRWEVTPYWSDANNHNPVVLPGIQSEKFPTAPVGYAFPGDPGVPTHMANTRWNNFGPRLGVAYSPDASKGILHALFGDHGQSSIRAGFGVYYTNIGGANTFNFAAAPYALFYSSPAPPMFDKPFVTRASGDFLGQRFPIPPVTSPEDIDWSQYLPISGTRNPLPDSPSPYSEHVDLSIQRQLTPNTLLSASYVGTFGHHLIVNADGNPGNAALCLGLSQTSQVMPDTATCGPYGQNGTYYPVGGGVVTGTRQNFGPNFGGIGYQLDIGNSSYHALQTTLRHVSGRTALLASYTLSKALDDGSGFGDQVILNPNGTITTFRGLSAYDMTHNFTVSYTVELPFDKLVGRSNRLTRGWKLSGITQFTTGVPIQISEPDDHSLLGNTGNSAYSGSTDAPMYTPGKIYADTNPRHGNAYFNTSLFSEEPIGQQGNAPRRFFHGPGINNWNLSLLKDLKLTERASMEFRAEFFNAFNHAQFYGLGVVDGNFTHSTFGLITSAADPRIGQLGVKVMF
ncbi:MAG: carboxypeptidase regulatory-like domain-containing protein [Acidobacteria bacterium]|nr:carboxypeptidase regulatory-like domain-containing protein [Acidobacteriota bacterium]